MTTARALRPHSELPGLRARQFGFTLVELIVILIVTGILGAVVAPRFFDRNVYDVAAFSNQTTALIRYAQKQAIAQNRNVYVRLNGTSVALCYDAACASLVVPPGRSNSASAATVARCNNIAAWACEGVPDRLALSTAPTFFFDPAGTPFYATDGAAAITSTFTARLAVRVSGGGLSRDTLIEPETGFVQ